MSYFRKMELPPYEEYDINFMYFEETPFADIEKFYNFLKRFLEKNRSMMSGHSPVSHHEMFEFKDGHSVPPSTSKEFSGTENVLKTSVVLDTTDSVPTTGVYSTLSTGNNLRFIDSSLPCVDDKVPLAEHEDLPNTSGASDELKDDSKLCEDDRPDGTWSPKDEKEPQSEEDICIKCLYVSMKCCECSIM